MNHRFSQTAIFRRFLKIELWLVSFDTLLFSNGDFLIKMFFWPLTFDPATHIQTDGQTIFFHKTLPTVEGTDDQLLWVSKIDVLLTFDPNFVPRFGLPDPDYPRSDQVPTIIGHLLWFSKIDVLLTPMQTHTQTHKLFFFIWPSLQSRELFTLYSWSR